MIINGTDDDVDLKTCVGNRESVDVSDNHDVDMNMTIGNDNNMYVPVNHPRNQPARPLE